MSKMMLVALVMAVGCASESSNDGMDVTTFPDRVEGTFTQNGISVGFEITETTVIVRTIDGAPVYEATLENGIEKTNVIDGLPEGMLVEPLRDALGEIACPPPFLPRFWWALSNAEAVSVSR